MSTNLWFKLFFLGWTKLMGSSPILLKIQDYFGPKVLVLSREFCLSFTLDRRVPALSLGTRFGLSANVRTSSSWLPYELRFHRQSLPSMRAFVVWVSLAHFVGFHHWKRSPPQNLKALFNFIVALKTCQLLGELLASWTNPFLGVKGLIVINNKRHFVVGSLQSGELPYHLNSTLSWLQVNLSFKGSQI